MCVPRDSLHSRRKACDRDGHALAFVLPVVMALGLVGASLTSWLQTEIHINDRHILRQQAMIAAESALEYGAAQLGARFDSPTGVDSDDLLAGNDPLTLPDSAFTHFAGSRVIVSEMRVQGGLVEEPEWTYIDEGPGNQSDPLRGRTVLVRNVAIYAKGVAANSTGRVGEPAEAYVMEVFQIRDAPLFSHAIFYNSDLEINPGNDLDVRGPVHANGDVYIGANPDATLTLHNGLTAAGSIFHDEIRAIHIGGDVYPAGPDRGTMEYGETYLDSEHENWADLSRQRWDGLVLDGSTGVKTSNPAAIGNYQPDDFETREDETQNTGYAIIEPLLPHDHPNRKDPAVRDQKMEANAGLVLRVEGGAVNAYRIERDGEGNVNWDANGDATYIPVTLPPGIVGAPDAGFRDIRSDGNREVEAYEHYWDGQDFEVTRGMYDHRDDIEVDLVAIDVGELEEEVEQDFQDEANSYFGGNYDVSKHWNGVIYFESPLQSAAARDDGIVRAADEGLALMLIDGGDLPDPGDRGMGFTVAANAPIYVVGNYNADGANHGSGNSSTEPEEGEVPAAIIGDIVTILSNNWADNRDDSHVNHINYYGERPASDTEIAAAIMSGTPVTIPEGADYVNGRSEDRPLSLGVVNLPRFLEYWGPNRTLTIRGSLVSLYQSEVRPDGAPENGFNAWYVPPQRNWGFSGLFAGGRFPPGSPVVRTYRRTAFREIDKATYEAEIAKLANL